MDIYFFFFEGSGEIYVCAYSLTTGDLFYRLSRGFEYFMRKTGFQIVKIYVNKLWLLKFDERGDLFGMK